MKISFLGIKKGLHLQPSCGLDDPDPSGELATFTPQRDIQTI